MKIKFLLFGFIVLMAIPIAWFAILKSHTGSFDSDAPSTLESDEVQSEVVDSGEAKDETPAGQRVDMRRRVKQTIEKEVAHLSEESAVDGYLAMLKGRAQAQKQVTVLEVEPGIQAIMKLETILGPEETHRRVNAYETEMAALSRSLGGVLGQTAPVTAKEMETMLDGISNAADEATKQATIRKYVEAAEGIEDMEEQMQMMAQLDEIMARDRKEQAPPDFNLLEANILNSRSDDARLAAIRQYTEAVQSLEPEAQAAAIKRMEELIPRPASRSDFDN